MPIAVFYNKTFQVSSNKVYTFDGLSLSSSLQTDKQDAAGKKPSTYVKGPDLDTMGFNIPLRSSLGINVKAEYESWKAIEESGIAYPFILGGKPVGINKWLLKSVSLNNTDEIDSTGNIKSGMLQLQFEEYVRPGSAQANQTSTSKSSAPAVKVNKINPKIDLLASNKAAVKRRNGNVFAALTEGPLR